MSTTFRSAAKALARALPDGVKERLRGPLAQRAFQLNTQGLAVDDAVLARVSAHRRPVSIVIPSYNDEPLLRACLSSIADTCSEFDYEIIVVDDYCQPANTERLRAVESEFDRARMVFKERRQGFAVSVNVGMAQAKHDIVLLNSDIVAQPGWLDALQFAAYERDPAIGLVSPKLVYPDGRIQYGGTYYARVLAPQWFGHLYVGSPASRPLANVPGYNRSISGACVYIRREAYERLGGLDEGYWLGFEDVDYGLQAWREGIRCWYEPQSLLIHHESASRGYSQGKRELASMRRFWDRWRSSFLEREVADAVRVDFVISPAAAPVWRRYVLELVSALGAEGLAASVHEQEATGRDENLVAELADDPALVVCADWGAAETVWLATLHAGKPVYLLPTVESGDHPHDPALQTRIVAGYRPEFEYIAANRWGADQLRAETAWEVRHRLVPALKPPEAGAQAAAAVPLVVTVGLDASARLELDRAVHQRDARVQHLADAQAADLSERVRELRPSVVVTFEEFPNSLVPLSLMATGAAYVGRPNPRTSWEVLDGYNALLVDPADGAALGRALDDLLGDDDVRSELAANGRRSAERAAALTGEELAASLRSIARVSV
ncbi:glycosyltransferase [Leifsonia virtsii]|uniref:Glycosyltransferase family 2 protein n=1 Tax=Leifsonia virtsii TaxID=3035915 RepID=A0ABT8J1C2_9MICO|nr:glycosyltransferase family 2 protein [Leifsonia virtsii]MDN4598397.1 glycosyltransferase family 2 protein [Leifsonia virtsii]